MLTTQEDYKKAQRIAKRSYQAALSEGRYPYLPVLEQLLAHADITGEQDLGVQDIDISQIAGTYGRGRSTSFSCDFMPLLEENSEFAFKWMNLCQTHLEEGIRDPIKCYEFLNHYYVIEGNKRVSVLKYFKAVTISAHVIRLQTHYNHTHQARVYREYLEFYKHSKVNYCIMSHRGNYARLTAQCGFAPDYDWTEDDRKNLRFAYSSFLEAFREMGGDGLVKEEGGLSYGDAFVEYLKFYEYSGIKPGSGKKLRRQLKRIWPEMLKVGESQSVSLQTAPDETESAGLLKTIWDEAFGQSKPLRIAFIHDRDEKESGWTASHEEGRMQLEEKMGSMIQTTAYMHALDGHPLTPEEYVEKVASEEYDVIFTTSPRLRESCLKASAGHPKTKILNCSVNFAYNSIRCYYGRMYEVKFLSGLVAGSLSKSNNIAYIAYFPMSGLISDINAFARGVSMVNPEAKVHLLWKTLKNQNIDEQLKNIGADIISTQDTLAPSRLGDPMGLYRQNEDGSITQLAMPYWNWELFYERILHSILNGGWDNTHVETPINYWWGLNAGVIDIILSDDVPESVRQMVIFFKKALRERSFSPFDGRLIDQSGENKSGEDGVISLNDIVKMKWLLNNIEGEIPPMEAFNETAQKMMRADKV